MDAEPQQFTVLCLHPHIQTYHQREVAGLCVSQFPRGLGDCKSLKIMFAIKSPIFFSLDMSLQQNSAKDSVCFSFFSLSLTSLVT